MQDITLNTWYQGESVAPADMIKINQTFIQTMFAGNGGTPQIIGGGITVSGNNFNIAKGFVYFGESTDSTYITRTGTNQLCAVILANNHNLVNANCYIYVNYTITYDPSNRTATITSDVYSSVNPNDAGIKICDIVNSVPTNYANHNITNYFALGLNNNLVLTNPSGDSSSLSLHNLTATGDIHSLSHISSDKSGNFGGQSQGEGNSFITNSVSKPGYVATVNTYDSPIGGSVYVTNGSVQGGLDVSLSSLSGGYEFFDVYNTTSIGDGSLVFAGRAYYTQQGNRIYPSFQNRVLYSNNAHISSASAYPDANGNPVLELINRNATGDAGIIVNWNTSVNLWNRPQLAGVLNNQFISANPNNNYTPNAIYTLGDFRNGIFYFTNRRYYVIIRASWNGTNWYCTLNGFVHLTPNPGQNTLYDNILNLSSMFGIGNIAPTSVTDDATIGTVSRYVRTPIQQDLLGGSWVLVNGILASASISVGLQFCNVPGVPSMEASFVCQFFCDFIGNF